MGRYNDDLYI